MAYVYKLTHKQSGKIYIGCRYAVGSEPDDLLVTYFSSSKIVRYLIQRFGVDSFQKEILCVCETEEVLERESHFILQHEKEKLLNVCIPKGVERSVNNHTLTLSGLAAWHGNEARKKEASSTMRARWSNPETRESLVKGVKRALSEPEVRKRISQTLKRRFIENPELSVKMSVAAREYFSSLENRDKQSAISLVRWRDQGYRDKVVEGLRDFYSVEENNAILRKARETRWGDPQAKNKQSKIMSERHLSKPVWNRASAPKRRDVWEKAGIIFGVWVVSGMGYKSISKVLGLESSTTVKNIIKLFRGGWNPCLDKEWMEEFQNGL